MNINHYHRLGFIALGLAAIVGFWVLGYAQPVNAQNANNSTCNVTPGPYDANGCYIPVVTGNCKIAFGLDCPSSWVTGDWSSCSDGTQTRTVTCETDEAGVAMGDQYCGDPEPTASQSCDTPGSCGSAATSPQNSEPTTDLCSYGQPSAVTAETGPSGISDSWNWTCTGDSGTSPTSCSASNATCSWYQSSICTGGTETYSENCGCNSAVVSDQDCENAGLSEPLTPTPDSCPVATSIVVNSVDASNNNAPISSSWSFSSYPDADPCQQGTACSGTSQTYTNDIESGSYTLAPGTAPIAPAGEYYTPGTVQYNPGQYVADGSQMTITIPWELHTGTLTENFSATPATGTVSTAFALAGMIFPSDQNSSDTITYTITYQSYPDCPPPISSSCPNLLPTPPSPGYCSGNNAGVTCSASPTNQVYIGPSWKNYAATGTYVPELVATQGNLMAVATTTIVVGSGSPSQTLSITPTSLLDATDGSAYSETLNASGTATGPFTWAVLDPTDLPPGITLGSTASASDPLAGTPTATGTYNFTVNLSNSVTSTSQVYSLTVNAGSQSGSTTTNQGSVQTINISPTTLPDGTVGTLYDQQLNQGGNATGPFTWSQVSGNLPSQLSLGALTGTLSSIVGTPDTVGTSTFTIGLTNGTVSTTQAYTLYVGPANDNDTSGNGGQPPDCDIQASQGTILVGATTTISWSCGANPPATSCTLDPSGQSVDPSSGSMTVQPHATQVYDLSCTDTATTTPSISQVTVTVNSNPGIIEVTP